MARTKQTSVRPKAKSLTQDMVGDARPDERINPKWRKHFYRLMELREHLARLRGDLTQDALDEQPAFSMHMADAASDSYDRDFALGLLSHEQDAVYEIEEALNRIRDGTYGTCELTGRPIPARRLEAVPWTRFTAAAETSLERSGDFQRAHLGPCDTLRGKEPKPETEPET
jgi:DnaK suppressor protein